MRLSSKLFMALAVLAGSIFGFAPDASAHLRTSMVAAATGTVSWLGTEVAPFNDVPGTFTDIALDACYKAATQDGLPLGIPGQPQMLEDRCFEFSGVVIQAAGAYELQTAGAGKVKLDYTCAAAGVSTASAGLLGTFYGELDCDELDAPLPATPEVPDIAGANGHFHGLSRDTTIAFLGTICDDVSAADLRDTVPGALPAPAPDLGPDGTCVGAVGVDTDGLPDQVGTVDGVTAVTSGIKHTLACKGTVVPLPTQLFDTDSGGVIKDGIVDAVGSAAVALECVIA